jgi:hypothetical protein
VLAPVTVTAARYPLASLYLAGAAPAPKTKPLPRRRAPRRSPPPKRAPPRRPQRAPARPVPRSPRISPVKIAKFVGKRFPIGRMIEFADILSTKVLETFGLVGAPPPADRYFAPGAGGKVFPKSGPSMTTLAPVVVNAPRANPLLGTLPALDFFAVPGSSPTIRTQPRPRTSTRTIGRPQTTTRTTARQPLTRAKQPGVKSQLGTLNLTEYGPTPKEALDRDPCRLKRRAKRNKCPARGYKLQATAWRKVPCQ